MLAAGLIGLTDPALLLPPYTLRSHTRSVFVCSKRSTIFGQQLGVWLKSTECCDTPWVASTILHRREGLLTLMWLMVYVLCPGIHIIYVIPIIYNQHTATVPQGGYSGMIRRFCSDDPHFWDFWSDCAPILCCIPNWLTPSFCRKNQFVSIRFSSRHTKNLKLV